MTLLNQSNPLFELEMKLDKADQLEFENRDFKTERKQGGKKCLHAMLIYLLLLTALSAYLTYKVFALQAEIHSYEYLLSKNSKLLSSTPTGVFPSVGQLQDTPQEFLSLLKNTSLEISTLRGDVSELQMRFTAVCEGPDGLSRQRKELDLLNKSIHSLQRNLDSLNHRANGNLLSLPTNTSLESNSLLGEMREMQDRFTALFEGHGGIQWLRENLNLLNVSTQYLKSRLDSLSLRAGLPGPRGPKGETGTAGARGPKGDQGSQGDQGRPGASGMKGEKGQKGEQEILDDQLLTLLRNTSLEGSSLRGNILDLELRFTDLCEGSGGLRWIKQELGLVNISTQFLKNQLDSLSQKPGLPGPRGPKGDQGVEGAHGPKGDQGAKGTEGRQGVPGIKGEKGEQGNQGSKGEQGFQGLRGLPGAKGEKGIRGITGLQGLKGEKGAKGEAVLGSNVRIAGGGSRGRVEVFVEGLWGTICDDEFDVTDGGVICRMLGYQKATSVFTGPSGTGKIWMDNLQCTGDEISIFNCKHRGLGVNDCSHSEDAAVVCV